MRKKCLSTSSRCFHMHYYYACGCESGELFLCEMNVFGKIRNNVGCNATDSNSNINTEQMNKIYMYSSVTEHIKFELLYYGMH